MNIRKFTDILIFSFNLCNFDNCIILILMYIFIFPFTLVENNEIPYENLIAIRLAIFATFAFYGNAFVA